MHLPIHTAAAEVWKVSKLHPENEWRRQHRIRKPPFTHQVRIGKVTVAFIIDCLRHDINGNLLNTLFLIAWQPGHRDHIQRGHLQMGEALD